MANPQKFDKHHAKAGEAFRRGDMKTAAHHMGHALASLRGTSAPTDAADVDDGDVAASVPAVVPAPAKTLRERLARMKPPAPKQ